MKPLGLLVAGVSGQGVEQVAGLLAQAALAADREVQLAVERPGAHRGASMRCHVRISFGEVRSPFVGDGEADLLLALERLEGLRWVHQVAAGGLVVVSDCFVPTPRARLGLDAPPPDLLERLRRHVPRSLEVPAAELARQIGAPGCMGGVLLGVVAPLLPLPEGCWDEALRRTLAGGEQAAWRLALQHGRELLARQPDAIRLVPDQAA